MPNPDSCRVIAAVEIQELRPFVAWSGGTLHMTLVGRPPAV